MQCGEMKNLLHITKKIRQINYLVTSLVKTLFSRNFRQSCVTVRSYQIVDLTIFFSVTVNFSFLHTALCNS